MSALNRYALLQIPGWIAFGTVLLILWMWNLVSGATAGIVLALWLLKDIVAYPLVRRAYERQPSTRVEELVGSRGEVRRSLAPKGLVRIRGELWKAELAGDDPSIPAGSTVVVRRVRGLTLIVEPVEVEGATSANRGANASIDPRSDRRK